MLLTLALALATQPQVQGTFADADGATRLVRIGSRTVFLTLEPGVPASFALRSIAEGSGEAELLQSGLGPGILVPTPLAWNGLSVHPGPVVSDGTPQGTRTAGDFSRVDPVGFGVTFGVVPGGLALLEKPTGLNELRVLLVPEPDAAVEVLTIPNVFNQPLQLLPVRGGGVFKVDKPFTGTEWWFTDGTPQGSGLVLDLVSGSADGVGPAPAASDGERVYFEGLSDLGLEPWVTDGTAAGTRLLADLALGNASSRPIALRRVGGSLILRATSPPATGVWSIDVETGAAQRFDAVGAEALPVAVQGLDGVPSLGFLVERIESPTGPDTVSVWATRGTPAETELLPVTDVGTAFTQIASDGTFLFSATDGGGGLRLWRTDGTAAGTAPVPEAGASEPFEIVLAGDRILWRGGENGQLQLHALSVAELGLSSIHRVGVGCPTAPELTGSGLPKLGSTIQFDLAGGAPGQAQFLLVGDDLLPPPAQGLCGLQIDATLLLGSVSLDPAGAASLPVGVPANPALAGRVLRAQAFGAEAGGPVLGAFTASGTLEILIGS